MQSFAELGVSKPVVRALEARGIEEPFAIQSLVIGDVLAGRDVLAKSPTGSSITSGSGSAGSSRAGSSGSWPSEPALLACMARVAPPPARFSLL